MLAGSLRESGGNRFEVRSADLELLDGVYHMNARIDLPISDAVRRGLSEGVPLTLEVDPSHLSSAIVNQYLSAKERNII